MLASPPEDKHTPLHYLKDGMVWKFWCCPAITGLCFTVAFSRKSPWLPPEPLSRVLPWLSFFPHDIPFGGGSGVAVLLNHAFGIPMSIGFWQHAHLNKIHVCSKRTVGCITAWRTNSFVIIGTSSCPEQRTRTCTHKIKKPCLSRIPLGICSCPLTLILSDKVSIEIWVLIIALYT